MDTKLTLSVDKAIIKRAKSYAKAHKISLSSIIESYLDTLTKNKDSDDQITPLVSSLSGVIDLPADYDLKDDYAKYLLEKYK